MSDQTLPSGGGSYIREKDGTLRPEAPAAEAGLATGLEAPVEEAVERPAKRTVREA